MLHKQTINLNGFVMGEIYSLKIMEIAAKAPVAGQLKNPDAQVKRVSRVCGSSVEVSVKVREGIVREYGQETNCCVLGQASASVLAANIVGSAVEEIYALRDQMEAMLKQGGEPPGGKWDELKHLQPVREYGARHASTMLAFNAVVECFEQIRAKQT